MNKKSKKPDIYYEPGQMVEYIAFIKQFEYDNKAVEVSIGKFDMWLSAFNHAKKKYGARVVLVEPK